MGDAGWDQGRVVYPLEAAASDHGDTGWLARDGGTPLPSSKALPAG
jgi:hypothetical protein